MEVRIGILNAPREVTIDMADDTSADERGFHAAGVTTTTGEDRGRRRYLDG